MKYKPKTKPAPWVLMRRLPKLDYVLQKSTKSKTFKPIRSATTKRAKELRKYSADAKVYLENRNCAVHGKLTHEWFWDVSKIIEPATQIHHTHGRMGSLLNYQPWWLACCATCHRWIEDNKAKARALGFLCELGEWNVAPKEI